MEFVRNNQHDSEQVLVIGSTTRVSPEELNKYLEVYELPRSHPEEPNDGVKEYDWSMDSIPLEVLLVSKKLEITPIPTQTGFF